MIYKFTEAERRVILQAKQRYLQVLMVIAELHDLNGRIDVDEDCTGFIDVSAK